MACYFNRVVLNRLDIDSHWMIAHRTSHRLMAVAQAKMNVGATLEHWFAVSAIVKHWGFIYAILEPQSPMQEPISRHTEALIALLTIPQGIFTPLRADLG